MERPTSEEDKVAKKKRGAYKKYTFHENDSKIPRSTKRSWRQKLRTSSEKQRSRVNTISNQQKCLSNLMPESEAGNSSESFAPPIDEFSQPQQNKEDEPSNTRSDGLEDLRLNEKYTSDTLIRSLLVLATKLRYSLSYEAAVSMFKLTSVMGGTKTPEISKYFLKKIVNDYSNSVTVHYICEYCKLYAGEEGVQTKCLHCDTSINATSSLKSDSSFLYISLSYQLKEIFETTTAHDACEMIRRKHLDYAIEDIYDGELFKRDRVNGMLSINFSVDGAPVFESSNSSIYPIFCTINELEPRKRNQHVLLCGLWFGTGKPPINEYLTPFVTETIALYNVGFTYTYNSVHHTKKCRVLAGVCDSVARPMLRNSRQFNGTYGCGLCLHSGENIAKGRGHVRVYPLSGKEKNAFGEGLRSHAQTLIHAEQRIKGIKGRSILCNIPGFDIVESLNVDWMHSVNLGVCRQLANLWFNSVYHKEEFYIGNRIEDVDGLILSYSPTLEISRTPRRISDRVHWKAHEWATWLLFYSLPTLSAFLPKKYVSHWALLVDGIQPLCTASILKSEIVYCQRCLIDFIDGVEKLYGREHVSFNVHLLAHLANSVTRLGPLWTHSAFVYENSNQILLNYVKSSFGVGEQICTTFRTKYVVDRLRMLCFKQMTKEQRTYLHDVLNKSVRPEPTLKLENAGMLGTASMHRELRRDHYLAFERANVRIEQGSCPIASYERAIINGEIIHSKSYKRVQKRSNYYVQLIDHEIFEIHVFYVINKDNNVSCYALGKYFEKQNNPLFKNRKLSHLLVLKNRLDDFAVIDVAVVKEKVMVLPVHHLQISLACVHPNHFELLT